MRDCRSLLTPDGTYVCVTSPKSTWLNPLPRMLAIPLAFAFRSQKAPAFKVASRNTDDIAWLAEQVATGRLEPLIEDRRPLEEAPDIIRRQGEFHARGKTLVIP